MDVSVKPTEMQKLTIQTKYLFWRRTLRSSGLNCKGSGCLWHQMCCSTGAESRTMCVLEENFLPMALIKYSFLQFLKASVIFTLKTALGSYLHE